MLYLHSFAKLMTKTTQKFNVITETELISWGSLKSKTTLHIHMLTVLGHFIPH